MSDIDLSTDIRAARMDVQQASYAPRQVLQTTYKVEDGRIYVGRTADMTKLAEYCKAMHNEGYHGSSEMKFVGSFHPVLVEKYCNDLGITYEEFMNDDKHIERMATNPDNAAFRIWKGAL